MNINKKDVQTIVLQLLIKNCDYQIGLIDKVVEETFVLYFSTSDKENLKKMLREEWKYKRKQFEDQLTYISNL